MFRSINRLQIRRFFFFLTKARPKGTLIVAAIIKELEKVVRGVGLSSRGASCKRHEMSSIKNVWGGVG